MASVSGKGKALEKHGIKHRSASRYEAAARRAVLKLRRVYQCPRRKKGFTFPGMPFLLENVQPFLTIDQTASLLQVSRRTITRWIGSGQLPRLKPIKGAKAGRVLVARSEIERFLTEAAQ
jgi:excisionase family DNA binding protein